MWMIMLWAALRLSFVCSMNSQMPGMSEGGMTVVILGICPFTSLNGAYPVDWFALAFSANLTMGSLVVQSLWSGLTIVCSTCTTF